jgi:hypothetical protein
VPKWGHSGKRNDYVRISNGFLNARPREKRNAVERAQRFEVNPFHKVAKIYSLLELPLPWSERRPGGREEGVALLFYESIEGFEQLLP